MDLQGSNPESNKEGRGALRTYLHDHTAGAQHAVELLRALGEAHAGTFLGVFADEMLQQVSEDLRVLEGFATNAGAQGFQLKELAGWLADKVSRLKLAPLGNAFNTFEALEFLSLGILGKRTLWQTLQAIGRRHADEQGTSFAALIARADAQYASTEAMRLRMAVEAFGGPKES